MPERSWVSNAACRKMDTSLFFVDRGETIAPEVVAACEGCTVRADCLADALLRNDSGYRAGTSQKQRRNKRSRSGRPFLAGG